MTTILVIFNSMQINVQPILSSWRSNVFLHINDTHSSSHTICLHKSFFRTIVHFSRFYVRYVDTYFLSKHKYAKHYFKKIFCWLFYAIFELRLHIFRLFTTSIS